MYKESRLGPNVTRQVLLGMSSVALGSVVWAVIPLSGPSALCWSLTAFIVMWRFLDMFIPSIQDAYGQEARSRTRRLGLLWFLSLIGLAFSFSRDQTILLHFMMLGMFYYDNRRYQELLARDFLKISGVIVVLEAVWVVLSTVFSLSIL